MYDLHKSAGATLLVLMAAAQVSTVAAQQTSNGPTLALDAALTGIYDSNIHRDRTELGLYGGGLELLTRYANRTKRPTLQLEYAVVRRASSPVEIEAPFGHRVSALVAAPLSSGIRLELIGRGSNGGVDEDFNPGNELALMPRLELEPNGANRLRLYATRLWRNDAPPAPPTPGLQAGGEYRLRVGAVTLQTAYRYELLEPIDTTRQWQRSSGTMEMATRLSRRSTLELSGRYRVRDYPNRLISVGDERQLRHDEDWRASAVWVYRNDSGSELRVGYEQEARTSNDVRRSYQARRALLSMRQTVFRWRGGGAPRIDDDRLDVGGRGVRAPLAFTSIAALDANVCAVTADGAAHCWASDAAAPEPNAKPKRAPTGEAWTQLAAGARLVCGLTTSKAAYCWMPGAANAAPALVRGGHTFSSIAVGHDHVCALTVDARAYCWGSNREGALGDGSLKDSWEPVRVAGDISFRALAAGARHSCAIATYHVVYCWGSNAQGQLGVRHATRALEPAPIDAIRLVAISAGTSHTCGIDADGGAWCWGENSRGQLGSGTAGPPLAGSGAPPPPICARAQNHNCTGQASLPQQVRSDVRFTTIAAGWAHSCALSADGQAYCWGQNRYGQLGIGSADELSHTAPALVQGRRIFTALSASFRTCGLRASGTVECWGADAAAPHVAADAGTARRGSR